MLDFEGEYSIHEDCTSNECWETNLRIYRLLSDAQRDAVDKSMFDDAMEDRGFVTRIRLPLALAKNGHRAAGISRINGDYLHGAIEYDEIITGDQIWASIQKSSAT